MTCRVVVAEAAREQIRAAHDWWVMNRPAAPSLFDDELDRALALLASAPDIGPRFLRARRKDVRRILLKRTRCDIYYLHDRQRSLILVVAVWGAPRGDLPRLG